MAGRKNDGAIDDRAGAKAPPLGMNADGELNVVEDGVPPYEPTIVDPDEDFSDLEDDEDDDAA